MRNFHLIRIVVTLSLIVTLTFQPVAVCLASVGCFEDCSDSSTLACRDCGCCEVERADDLCCCCCGGAEAPEEGNEPACCGEKKSTGAEQSPDSVGESAATLIAPVESGLRAICLCEQESQPLSDSTPQRPTNDHRDTLSLTGSGPDSGGVRRHLTLAAAQYATNVPPQLRFSQVVLCIWRL